MVRDSQCKIWQRRRTALCKPQHDMAKTGGGARLHCTKSYAALGAKGDALATGSNAVTLGTNGRAQVAPSEPQTQRVAPTPAVVST